MLPSPTVSDTNGAGAHGDGGPDLRTAVSLLPTPTTTQRGVDSSAANRDGAGPNLHNVVALLPTPAVNDMGAAYTPEEWDEWTAKMRARHGNGNGHGKSLNVEVQRMLPTPTMRDQKGGNQRADNTCLTGALLPTPTAMDSRASGGNPDTTGHDGTTLTDATVRQPSRWGDYADAIHRHELALGRPAPAPTKLNARGNPKLSDEFDEWLMMLPAGWITDVPGITWNETLKACGNGVVVQQCVAALRWLLGSMGSVNR